MLGNQWPSIGCCIIILNILHSWPWWEKSLVDQVQQHLEDLNFPKFRSWANLACLSIFIYLSFIWNWKHREWESYRHFVPSFDKNGAPELPSYTWAPHSLDANLSWTMAEGSWHYSLYIPEIPTQGEALGMKCNGSPTSSPLKRLFPKPCIQI